MGSKLIQFLVILLMLALTARGADGLRAYTTKYYTIYTNAGPEMVREAEFRLTKMAQEYQRRTKGFSSGMAGQMPFYLYGDEQSYIEAGGRPGTSGMFTGQKLMAVVGEEWTAATWHVVQHEGFHQYSRERIGNLPIWVEEGLADYFGEAIFTGDRFIFGIIPTWRLRRVQQMIRGNRFRPMRDIMEYTYEDWNRDIAIENYDQAWSMVQFLAQAREGKLQKPFEEYVRRTSHGREAIQAWREIFGTTQEFQKAWSDYWLAQEDSTSTDLNIRATAEIFAAFLARAQERGQRFNTFGDFEKAADKGTLRCRDDLWLPPTMLKQTLAAQLESQTNWKLKKDNSGALQVVAILPDDRQITVKVALP
ncbi:MAG: DUF1570 domain-containing protein [Phycisphaerales bacterium]|nr:DUF1570 domain-containing protein [Phycisphaerales bacterium]